MNYRVLGNTGIRASEMCLGTMFFGTKVDKTRSFELLDVYRDYGGNLIDTANVYYAFFENTVGGESEEIIGEWVRARNGRSDTFIATKVGVGTKSVPAGLQPATVKEECDKSLKRLGVDCIDIYYLHSDDRSVPLDDILETCTTLIQAGKIRYLAASNFLAWRLAEAKMIMNNKGMDFFACLQCWYTYMQPRPGSIPGTGRVFISEEMNDFCRNSDLSILGYETLLRGVYSDPEKVIRDQFVTGDNRKRVETVRSLAVEKSVTPSQIVYAWMLTRDPKPFPIVTASNTEHLVENLGAAHVVLSEEDLKRLDNI